MAKVEITWTELDTSELPASATKLYDSYIKARETATAQRNLLEKALIAEMSKAELIPDGEVPAFAYKWGKISVGFTPATGSKAGKFKIAKRK